MNPSKKWQIGIALIMTVGMILQFQNCGPGLRQSGSPSIPLDSPSEGPPLTRIDDVKSTQGLVIPQPQYKLNASESDAIVLGVCNPQQTGAILSWRISRPADDGQSGNADETEINQGQAECRDSVFKINLEHVETLPCDVNLKLQAQLGLGGLAITTLYRSCL